MRILCHRGLWATRAEQNTLDAIRAAWKQGWGVETDVRDLDGELVVSHDPPTGGTLPFRELIEAWVADGSGTTLALNIKADGLAPLVAAATVGVDMSDHFVFDMSVPDQLSWTAPGPPAVPVYTRWSDIERQPILDQQTSGIWLDAFHDDGWWSAEQLLQHLALGLAVAIVSPELHGRRPDPVWERLRALGLHTHPGLSVCTDEPELAERFFQ